jgi:hypothetical protein
MLHLHPSDIEIGERHRAISNEAVERLAASMADIGLRHPITVRVVDEMMVDGHLTSGVPVLVAGAHRLAAAKKLGWQQVDCIEVEDDAVAAELWELAENLHRLDLTKDQRDQHIRRYAELLEARADQIPVQQNAAVEIGYGKPPPRPKGIPRQIAEETGLSVDTVRRALNPQPAPEPKNPLPDHDVVTVQFNSLVAAWNRAGREARDMFMDHIDAPVFDNTRAA